MRWTENFIEQNLSGRSKLGTSHVRKFGVFKIKLFIAYLPGGKTLDSPYSLVEVSGRRGEYPYA